ncbi:hypothetical protein BJV74DRAFT_863505 [Russula compacta]|nr:hypothetical protein BJV74DRAFT_863505 [Russula compacta]
MEGVSELQPDCPRLLSPISSVPQVLFHIQRDRAMPSQKKASSKNKKSDVRTRQQKAADTRKANKAIEERKARELQEGLAPHHAKQAAQPVWQPAADRKRKSSGEKQDADSEAKRLKTRDTDGQDKKQTEKTKGTNDRERFFVPGLEESDSDTAIPPEAEPIEPTGAQQVIACESESCEEDMVRPVPIMVKSVKGTKFNGKAAQKSPQQHIIDSGSGNDPEGKGSLANRSLHTEDADDGECMDVDEDNDLEGKDTASLEVIFKAGCPSWASRKGRALLFDDDNDVIEVADTLSHKSWPKHRESGSTFFSDGDLDEEYMAKGLKPGAGPHRRLGDLPPQGGPGPASKPAKKMLCQEAYGFEKPEWEESAAEPTDEGTITATTEPWPPEACIAHPISGELKLRDQHPKLARVVRGGIQALFKHILFSHSYPTFESRTSLARQWLYAAAKVEKADAISLRVKEDNAFVCNLQDLVFTRASKLRSSFKETASKGVTACYNLGGLDAIQIAKCVEEWLKDDRYIFPQVEGVTKLDLYNPFNNNMIILILRDVFHKDTSFITMHQDLFVSAHDTRSEPELPDSMVALAATAAYGALYEWHQGGHQIIPFTQAAYEDVYEGHISTLEKFRKQYPNRCHRVMSALYNAVMSVHFIMQAEVSITDNCFQ